MSWWQKEIQTKTSGSCSQLCLNRLTHSGKGTSLCPRHSAARVVGVPDTHRCVHGIYGGTCELQNDHRVQKSPKLFHAAPLPGALTHDYREGNLAVCGKLRMSFPLTTDCLSANMKHTLHKVIYHSIISSRKTWEMTHILAAGWLSKQRELGTTGPSIMRSLGHSMK